MQDAVVQRRICQMNQNRRHNKGQSVGSSEYVGQWNISYTIWNISYHILNISYHVCNISYIIWNISYHIWNISSIIWNISYHIWNIWDNTKCLNVKGLQIWKLGPLNF